ncbi:hypothetical protein Lesp02_21560 [Lentzea sp. NBRC 105346]|uniref:hypothetical protein n=1 Tax=Lentzea sp. NBRC 105346 TaxID=3032205 RepID=UPI0024A02AA4|nr:hypothetical protein [Lentzea sp. NBRC 105346]GLZ29966.1 hypothetical protein Lesp02_21560 [Lentzea sp. NBRC 105346]
MGVAAGCALLGAVPATAQPVTSGSWTFGGDPGDYISGGQDYKYSPQNGDVLTVGASEDRNHIGVRVSGVQGDWWDVDFAAPRGEPLTAKTYEGATRYPFQGAGPALSHGGNGRGCNTLTGTFTIQNVVFGPHGYVEKLDATYEQHCEGGPAALRGEMHLANAPAPAELALDATIADEGKANPVNGKAIVSGTVSCNVPVSVTVSGQVTQVKNNVIIRGGYWTSVACKPGDPVPWTAQAEPSGTTPFQKGKAEVHTKASAQDPNYNVPVAKESTKVVTLKKGTTGQSTEE